MHGIERVIRARMEDFAWSVDDEIQLCMVEKTDGKVSGYAQPVVMAPVASGDRVPVMTRLDKHSAQMLMDDLWQCGLRPSEGTGSAGSLAATQSHLADLRKIVFKQLKID